MGNDDNGQLVHGQDAEWTVGPFSADEEAADRASNESARREVRELFELANAHGVSLDEAYRRFFRRS